jgi:uncharacterized protein
MVDALALPVAGQPSRLPDVRQALDWRDVHSGLDEAAARTVPILCLAESAWSNGAQRLALALAQDDETRSLIEESFVPVWVDPISRPDVTARLRWAAATLTGTVGPPLLVLLTPRGAPFLAYCSIWPEGREPYPSLRSLLRSVSDLDRDRRTAIEAEAMQLQARARGRGASARRHTTWQAVRDDVDGRFGGRREEPKHPRPGLLWRLLDESAHPRVEQHVRRTLDAMQRGGILDQLTRSFHRCSRDERWIVPHFEKLAPLNAGLAAVYARAGTLFDRPDYLETAEGAAAFASECLRDEVMVVASDTAHYTWTPRQFQEELDPALVQALGLHFKITSDDSPHVLFRALEPEEMTDYADESVDVLHERVERGREILTRARERRSAPARQRVDAPAWHAETLRWLYEAARSDVDVDATLLKRRLQDLLDGPFDPAFGFARDGRYWLEDQAAILEACLAAGPEVADARSVARTLAEIVVEAYCDPEEGALSDAPRAQGARRPSQDVVDHALLAAVPRTVSVLEELSRTRVRDRGRPQEAHRPNRFARAAQRIERHHRDAALAASEAMPGETPRG